MTSNTKDPFGYDKLLPQFAFPSREPSREKYNQSVSDIDIQKDTSKSPPPPTSPDNTDTSDAYEILNMLKMFENAQEGLLNYIGITASPDTEEFDEQLIAAIDNFKLQDVYKEYKKDLPYDKIKEFIELYNLNDNKQSVDKPVQPVDKPVQPVKPDVHTNKPDVHKPLGWRGGYYLKKTKKHKKTKNTRKQKKHKKTKKYKGGDKNEGDDKQPIFTFFKNLFKSSKKFVNQCNDFIKDKDLGFWAKNSITASIVGLYFSAFESIKAVCRLVYRPFCKIHKLIDNNKECANVSDIPIDFKEDLKEHLYDFIEINKYDLFIIAKNYDTEKIYKDKEYNPLYKKTYNPKTRRWDITHTFHIINDKYQEVAITDGDDPFNAIKNNSSYHSSRSGEFSADLNKSCIEVIIAICNTEINV